MTAFEVLLNFQLSLLEQLQSVNQDWTEKRTGLIPLASSEMKNGGALISPLPQSVKKGS